MATRKKKDQNTILILLGGAALLLYALNKKGSLTPAPETATPLPDPNAANLNPATDLPPLPEIPIASILPQNTDQKYLEELNNNSGTLTVKNPAMFAPKPTINSDYGSVYMSDISVSDGPRQQAYIVDPGMYYADGWNPNQTM